MDFDLTEDQREIKSVARELLAARSPIATVRQAADAGQYDAALWHEIVELGWPGIAVAEPYGGQGLGAVELAVLLEELGYACASTPLLSTAVAAAAIQAGGTDEQRERWLPGLVAGEITAGVGIAGADRRRPRGRRSRACSTATPRAFWRWAPDPRCSRRSTRPGATHASSSGAPGKRRGARRRRRGARARRGGRRSRRSLPAGAGHDPRVRQGPQAVRRARRLLPGGRPPLRADAAAHRERPLHGVLRRLGGRRRSRPPRRGRRRWRPPRRPPRAARSRPRRSRLTAGSASPGRPTCTGCTSAPRSTAALLGGPGRHLAALARVGCRAGRGARRLSGWPRPPARGGGACSNEGWLSAPANCLVVRQPQGVTT